jgi:drug/metabolite transporter (DMT)-like permease
MIPARPAGRPLLVLALLTVVWGLNWPVMKLGVSGPPDAPVSFPPLTFRALSMLIGVPVLALGLMALRVPLSLPRRDWAATLRLTASNMIVWHVLIILALPALSSGRAAILGYTMPVFAALWAVVLYGERPGLRQALSVAAAALGVALLLAPAGLLDRAQNADDAGRFHLRGVAGRERADACAERWRHA